MFLQRNLSGQVFVVPGSLRAVADGSAVTAGATLTVVKDGTAAASAGTLAHVSGGAWKYVPTQSESDCKILGYVLEGTGAVTVCGSIRTTAADPNSASLGLSLAKTTNITGFNDVAATAIVSGGAITTAGGAVSTVTTATSLTSLPAIPAGWLTAAGIAASALAGKGDWLSPTVAGRTLAVGATGEAGADVTKVGGAAIPTPAVAGVLEVDVTHVLGVAATLADGTAQAGSSTTITLAAGDPAGANAYVDRAISIAGGTGVGQSRFVTAYSSTTKVATVHRAWDVTPDGTSQYAIGDTAAASLGPAGVDAVTVEAGLNLRQAIAILLAYVAGVKSGVTTATPTVSNPAGTATRAAPTVDADGNCSAVTLTPPA
jgi:hypothetical protein